MLFGVSQLASPVILMCCFLILGILGVKKSSFQNIGVRLLYVFIFVYYFIGIGVRLYSIEIDYQVDFSLMINNLITSIIILLTIHQYLYNRLIYQPNEKTCFNSLYIPVLLSSFFAVYQSTQGIININGEENGRIMGFFANPNDLGLVCNIALGCTFYSIYHHHRNTIFKFICIPLLLYVSFLTLSRAAMLTNAMIIIVSIFWFLIKYRRSTKIIRTKFIFISLLPIIGMFYLVQNFDSILLNYTDQWQAEKIKGMVALIFEGKIDSNTTSHRDVVVKFGIKKILENPLFGNGLSYYHHFPKATGFDYGVHNTHLTILGDAGLFAFLMYLAFMCYTFFRTLYIKPSLGFLVFVLMLIWFMQSMGSHNGLNDKMANIIIVYSSLYLIYGLHLKEKTFLKNLNFRGNE